jgi:hypothetical protein
VVADGLRLEVPEVSKRLLAYVAPRLPGGAPSGGWNTVAGKGTTCASPGTSDRRCGLTGTGIDVTVADRFSLM